MTGPLPSADLEAILRFVAERQGVDFRNYKTDAIASGLRSRIGALGATAAGYRRLLHDDPEEPARLLGQIAVSFSGFFRDPEVFLALERLVLPELRARLPRGVPLRAWSVGCAAGEEPWSLAMLLAPAPGMENGAAHYELLATDICEENLDRARRGLYAEAEVQAVPREFRNRHFAPHQDQWRIEPPPGGRVVFALHNLMDRRLAPREAIVPFFHLVAFRNVLIYFDRRLQEKSLERLLAVMAPGGALVLGRVESLPGAMAAHFDPWPGAAPSHRIFRFKGGP